MKVTVCVDYFTADQGSTMLCKDIELPIAPMCGDNVELLPETPDKSAWPSLVECRYIGPGYVHLHISTIGNRLDDEQVRDLRDACYREPGEVD